MRPTPPSDAGSGLIRISAELLPFNVVSGQFAEAKLRGVVANALETQLAPQFLKVKIVAVRDRFRHVHAETGQPHRRVARNQAFRKRCQRHRELDRRAGLGARRKGQLLVHHGQNAPVRRVDHNRGAVHVAQGIDSRLAHHRIFARRIVAREDIAAGKRTGGEALIVAMAADNMQRCAAQGACRSGHCRDNAGPAACRGGLFALKWREREQRDAFWSGW